MLAKTERRCPFTGRVLRSPNEGSSYAGFEARVKEAKRLAATDRKWFVLQTEPNKEAQAAAHLIARRFKTYLPQESVYTTRGARRRKVPVLRPLFRGYVFVRLSLAEPGWGVATTVPGVHRFLKVEDDFAIVPDDLMQRVFDIAEVLSIPKKIRGPSSIFQPGQLVRISEGPFTGINTTITALDDEERISVLLPLLGRLAKVHLAAQALEKL